MEVIVATALGLAGLVVVIVALRQDAVIDIPAPTAPDWDPLPSRSEIARTQFPLRVPGYDPASVELALDALADAYGDLLAEADSATIERARRRASARIRREDPPPRTTPGDDGPDGRGETAASAGATALDAPMPAAEGPDPGLDRNRPRPSSDAVTEDALRKVVALDALRESREDRNR